MIKSLFNMTAFNKLHHFKCIKVNIMCRSNVNTGDTRTLRYECFPENIVKIIDLILLIYAHM